MDGIYHKKELNTQMNTKNRKETDNGTICRIESVTKELEQFALMKESSLYEDICSYISRIRFPNTFIKKSGKLDEKKFYDYAYLNKNTWSNIRLNTKGISKDSALKLVIALQLTVEEAEKLIKKASLSMNCNEYPDRIVIALLNIRCYDPRAAAYLIEECRQITKPSFKNIYDMRKFDIEK